MDSHPKYKTDKVNTIAETKHCDYHGIDIEIKSNHPMTNSYNYSLKIEGTPQRTHSQLAQLSDVPNPSPTANGLNKLG